ncbi:hypothetical protein LUZ60_007787 [Juncus effusus]|nr:hypothetical protein LUZ60_007787 [Juncus effusus]
MGEPACVFQDFSLPSETSTSERMASALSALGESVSFGRFLSESLDWGRFSSFNQKKYLEEAKQYSRPGSVAQKKAFFEARYKKSALLRRSISVMETSSRIEDNFDSEIENSKEDEKRVSESEIDSFHTAEGKLESFDLGEEINQIESEKGEEINQIESETRVNKIQSEKGEEINQVNLITDSSLVEKCVNFETENKMNNSPEKEPLQESWVTNQSSKETKTEKISKIPNLKYAKIPKPFKSCPNSVSNKLSSKENISSNSNSSRISNYSVERIRPASKSVLHMSISHPIRAEVTPSKADVRTKIARFEAVSKSLKSTQSQNICPKSSKLVPRTAPQTPQSERKSAFGTNYSSRKMSGAESSHISTGNSRVASSKIDRHSFSFYRKSDKRDEKEEKAEIELKEFRQSLCYKARPLPDFYRKIDQAKESNNKVTSSLPPQSPVITRSSSTREKSNYHNAPAVPPPKPVLRRISSSKSGTIEPKLISQSVASFSKDQNKWTFNLSRR